MYSDILQTAMLLMLLWIAIVLWAFSYAILKIFRFVRFFTTPRVPLKITRRDFNLPFIQYVAAHLFIRYFFRKGR